MLVMGDRLDCLSARWSYRLGPCQRLSANSRVPDAVQRATLRRRAATQSGCERVQFIRQIAPSSSGSRLSSASLRAAPRPGHETFVLVLRDTLNALADQPRDQLRTLQRFGHLDEFVRRCHGTKHTNGAAERANRRNPLVSRTRCSVKRCCAEPGPSHDASVFNSSVRSRQVGLSSSINLSFQARRQRFNECSRARASSTESKASK